MRNETRAVLSILAVVSLLSACKQTSRDEAEPAPAATPAATAAPSAAVAEPTPAPAESINIPPPVQPNVPAPAPAPAGSSAAPAKKAGGESLKACCAALRKESETAADKSLYTTAAMSCDAIDKLVAAGTTKKSAALTQIRANLKGGKLPAGCD